MYLKILIMGFFGSVLYYSLYILAVASIYRFTFGIDDKPIKNTHIDIKHQIQMVPGDLLLPDGRLKMSGRSSNVTRRLNEENIKPGFLSHKVFNFLKFKRGTIHSVINNEHVFIIETVDRNYMGQFGFYYYRFNEKKFIRHKESLFLNQYQKLSEDFIYFKANYNIQTKTFSLIISDKELNDKFIRKITFNIIPINIKGEVEIVKYKNQESGFNTYPLFKDKRYWAKTFTQMNMEVNGNFSVENEEVEIKSSDKVKRWDANFNDWCGVLPHKTFFTQSWWFWRPGYKSNKKNIEHNRMSFYTQHGLQHQDNSRSETDHFFYDKKMHPMEPTLQWPNTDDYLDYWRMETHTEMRYSDSKIVGTFNPEYMFERKWDILIAREEERLIFGEYDVSELSLQKENDDKWRKTKAYGFVWQNYYHW